MTTLVKRPESCLSTVAEAVRKVMSVETQFRINDNESYPPLQTSPGYSMSSDGYQPNKSFSEKFAESNFQPIKPLNSSTTPSQRESENLDDPESTPPRERLNSGTQDSIDLPPSGDQQKQASPSYSDCYTSDSSCAATPLKWEPTSPQGPATPGSNPFNSLGPFSFHSPDKELEAAFVPRKDHNGMDLYFCHLCSFTGTSKEIFSAHMNTHFEHSCPHCDYTSRTEGRLKRHIKDFHSTSPPENYSGNKTAKAMPGRPKVYRCKQCEFVATEKLDFWSHARTHIKEDKLLQCPKCPFVTEYKHHLEYHLRNHFGSKPFKCSKCNYACVNKSMLNSHMKSHTNVYQYRCADCTYATKYCHSLKLHLRKYNHKPATVLNSDGSLPQGLDAEAAGLSLMMKRGPPRGPRGPRKDKLEAYLGQLMSMPPLGPRPGMNGLISPYWPLLGQFPGGFHPPPPLIPVSAPGGGAGGGGAMLNALPHHKPQGPGVSSGMCNQDQLTLKCTFCCFMTVDKDELTGHMLKVHASENQDLFNAFGISSDSLLEEQKQRAQRAEKEHEDHPADFSKKSANVRPPSHPTEALSMTESLHIRTDTADELTKSSPRSWPPASSETVEKENMNSCKSMPELFYLNEMKMSAMSSEMNSNGDTSDILRQMTLKFGGSVSSAVKENKECPLDLTKPKMMTAASYYVASKRTYEMMEASELAQESGTVADSSNISDAPSPSPRKRSRKGKAYKLDTISWKLQGMSSEHDSAIQEDAASTGSRDDGDDGAENSDHYSEKEFSDYTPRNRGDLNTSEEKDDFADSKITDTSTPIPSRKAGNNGSTFGGRDLEQLHNSLKILNENDADRKDGVHAEDRCPSPVSDLRRCSMGSNMGMPDLPVIGRSGPKSPSDFKEQHKAVFGSRSLATPAAVRKGAEIAWKILHPDQQTPAIPYQNGSTPQSFNAGEVPMSIPPAGNFPNMCTRLPPSQKLPTKVNGVNGAVHAASVGRKAGRQGSEKYECSYCEIAFRDCVMYTMHMGYHGYQDPYKCNMCGHQSRDKVDFFLHIARAAHA